VVVGQADGAGPVPGEVADVVARGVRVPRIRDAVATVVGQGDADDPDAGEAPPLCGRGSDEGEPILEAVVDVLWLAGEEPLERLGLAWLVVAVADFQAERGVLEGLEQLV